MNSARSVLLATMPPTFAAARNTTCGRASATNRNTAPWSRKSTSLRLTVSSSAFSCASLRTSAAPTIPPWPATKTVLPFSSNGVLAMGNLPPGNRKIARHHFLDELRKPCLRFPVELFARLAGVPDQHVDFGGTEIRRIDANDGLAGFPVDAGFFDALAAPFDAAVDLRECKFDEFAHRSGLARRQHEIVRRVRLQYPVHALDIIPGVTPIALRPEVSEIKRVFETGLDAGDAARNLARHEGFAADRAFMIEQDAVRGEHAVGFAIVHRDPVAVKLADAIGRARIERRGFLLRDLLHQTVQLRSGRLVEPRLLLHAENPDRFQQPQYADGVGIRGVFRAFETDADMALGGEVVDFGGPRLLRQPYNGV